MCLPSPSAGTCDGRVLLEQSQHERTFGRELSIDGSFGEPGSAGYVIERGELETSIRENLKAGLEQQAPGLGLAALPDRTHPYLRYATVLNLPTHAIATGGWDTW